MSNCRKYYTAYEERYKAAHRNGVSWASDRATPIVTEIIRKFHLKPSHRMLEIGCGEGRDAKAVLEGGNDLTAVDVSREAIAFCRTLMPAYASRFQVLDCLTEDLGRQYDFIYTVAVIHMLVPDEDRNRFYQFIYGHLTPDGLALICSMGDGQFEMESDISSAYEIQEREHPSGRMMVAATSCRMVSFRTFEDELSKNKLELIEKGITSALPEFNSLMYAVVRKG